MVLHARTQMLTLIRSSFRSGGVELSVKSCGISPWLQRLSSIARARSVFHNPVDPESTNDRILPCMGQLQSLIKHL